MSKLTITKEFQWDCAHCLKIEGMSNAFNDDIFGKCQNLHGHTYKMFVTVSSGNESLENGMIINFVELKKVVNELVVERFDHKYLNDDELYKDRLTTCENQINDIWDILEVPLKLKGIILEELKLYETPTSFATLQR